VWQKAKALAVRIYRETESFPGREAYGLTSQLRRASVSVASNIAEVKADSREENSNIFWEWRAVRYWKSTPKLRSRLILHS
jgi:four helix bundle protein